MARILREQRASKQRPCPACGHGTWCYFLAGGDAVWCGRSHNFNGVGGKAWKSGWIHRISEQGQCVMPTPRLARDQTKPTHNFERLATRWRRSVDDAALCRLAQSLGVSPESLTRIGIGWAPAVALEKLDTACRSNGCWSFPMRDGAFKIVGIRLRSPLDGFKYAVGGSAGSGLFIPDHLATHGDLLLLAEGPTTTAALLTLGFNAIGRPNCSAGVEHLRKIIGKLQPRRIVVIGDNDKHDKHGRLAGQESAQRLATAMSGDWVLPPLPFKDCRDWLKAGASRNEMDSRFRMNLGQ